MGYQLWADPKWDRAGKLQVAPCINGRFPLKYRYGPPREAIGPSASADPEGVGRGPDTPLGKSLFIWVSIGNKQMDIPGKSLTPPPHLENCGPLWNLENDRLSLVFFEINLLSSVK